MINYSLCFRKTLGLVSLVVLATQLPSMANAMDLPMEPEKVTKNRELSLNASQIEEERKHTIIPLMQEDLENNIIDKANLGDPAAQDALMDLYYQRRYYSVISSQLKHTFHLWKDVRLKCCENDKYAYFLIQNYKDIRKKFMQDSFAEIHAGIKKRAESKEPEAAALCNLAISYFNGYRVPQDRKKAQSLFKDAADKNHAPSQYSLVDSYLVGKKPHQMQPDSEAFQYAQKAAWQGYAPAQKLFHEFLQSDPIEECSSSVREFHSSLPSVADQGYFYYALKRLADAVDNPDIHAQYNLAQFYENTKDWINANDYYQKAVANGHSGAKSKLCSFFQQNSLQEIWDPISADSYFKNLNKLCKYRVVCKDWLKTIDGWITEKPGLNPIKIDFGIRNSLKSHKHLRSLPLSLSCYFSNDAETLEFPECFEHYSGEQQPIYSFNCIVTKTRSFPIPGPSVISKVNSLIENLCFNTNLLEEFSLENTTSLNIDSLLRFLKPIPLKQLLLVNTNISGQDIQTLINTLPKSLQLLDLIGNDFGDDECSAFLKKLPSLPNLKMVCLGKNYSSESYLNFTGSGLISYQGGSKYRKLVMRAGANPVISQPVLDDFKTKLDAALPKLEYLIFG